jgi:hypothetical protein
MIITIQKWKQIMKNIILMLLLSVMACFAMSFQSVDTDIGADVSQYIKVLDGSDLSVLDGPEDVEGIGLSSMPITNKYLLMDMVQHKTFKSNLDICQLITWQPNESALLKYVNSGKFRGGGSIAVEI